MLLDLAERGVLSLLRRLPEVRGRTELAWRWRRVRESYGPLDGEWQLEMRGGSQVVLPRNSSMSWAVAATGQWDSEFIEGFQQFITPRSLVLDVGASLGLWTIQLARISSQRGAKVWAFEPYPDNLRWLNSNVRANGHCQTVEVIDAALGAEEGMSWINGERGGGNAVVGLTRNDYSRPTRVLRLDDFELPARMSFIKLDVEGYELEVLRGARQVIERDRPVIFGEFNTRWLAHRGEDLPAFLCEMHARGWKVSAVERQRSRRWALADMIRLKALAAPFTDARENLLLQHSLASGIET